MSRQRTALRAVLAFGAVNGVLSGVQLARTNPPQVGIATDVYYYAARAVLEGGAVYAARPPDHPGFAFLYPPIVLLAVLPYGLLGDPGLAYAVQTLFNIGIAAAFATVMIRVTAVLAPDLARRDRLLVGAYAVGSFGAAYVFVMGQVNLLLALCIATGTCLVEPRLQPVLGPGDAAGDETADPTERPAADPTDQPAADPTERPAADARHPRAAHRFTAAVRRHHQLLAGVLFAVAGVVKLFPALAGVWLLRRRTWPAAAAAVGTAALSAIAGVLVFGPELTVTYVTEVLPAEAAQGSFADGPDPGSAFVTVRRQLAVVAPWLPESVLLPASLAAVAPVVLACYRALDRLEGRLLALQATLLAALVVSPLEPFYVVLATFPLVPLAYGVADRTARWLVTAGILLCSVPLRLGGARGWVEYAGLPAGIETVALDAVTALFTVAMPTTIGVWLIWGGALLAQHRAVRRDGSADAVPSGD